MERRIPRKRKKEEVKGRKERRQTNRQTDKHTDDDGEDHATAEAQEKTTRGIIKAAIIPINSMQTTARERKQTRNFEKGTGQKDTIWLGILSSKERNTTQSQEKSLKPGTNLPVFTKLDWLGRTKDTNSCVFLSVLKVTGEEEFNLVWFAEAIDQVGHVDRQRRTLHNIFLQTPAWAFVCIEKQSI